MTYLRPFYPQRGDEIRRSPYGHAHVEAPYAPEPSWELEIEGLLEDVTREHGIPYRLRYVTDPRQVRPDPTVPAESTEDVYRELIAKGGGLSGRRRANFDRDLRNTRGKVSPGTMLLVDVDGALRWYEGPWYGSHARIVQFLDSLLRLGPSHVEDVLRLPATYAILPPEAIERVAKAADAPVEGDLLRTLLRSGVLGAGEAGAQVPVGRRARWGRHGVTYLPRAGLKAVDLVYYAGPSTVWVVEAKDVLNWTALSQALGYATLFEEDYLPNPRPRDVDVAVRPAVVVRDVDETVLHCAEVRGVAVFAGGERLA